MLAPLNLQLLCNNLISDEILAKTAKDSGINAVEWQLAQFDPPITLPSFRRHEVWINLKTLDEASVDKFEATPQLTKFYEESLKSEIN